MSTETKLEELLTPKQAAKWLNVGPRRLSTLGIPIIHCGRLKRYDPADIRNWMRKYKVEPERIKESAPDWRTVPRHRAVGRPACLATMLDRMAAQQSGVPEPPERAAQRRSEAAKAAWQGRWEHEAMVRRGKGKLTK